MEKKTIILQRLLRSKDGKPRKGIYKVSRTKVSFSAGGEEDPVAMGDWLDELLGDQLSREDAIIKYMKERVAFAKRVIKKSGLDPDDREAVYILDNGEKASYFQAVSERKEKMEPEGYLQDILDYAKWLKVAIEKKDLFEALFQAIKMEEAYGKFDFAQYELEILIGSDVMAGGSKAAKFSKQQKDGWLQMAADLRLQNNSLNYSDIARSIVKRSNLEERSYQTVHKYLLNNKEKM